MLNEWAVGYVSNMHRIFRSCWLLDPDQFAPAIELCALIANEVFKMKGYALQMRERYAEKAVVFQSRLLIGCPFENASISCVCFTLLGLCFFIYLTLKYPRGKRGGRRADTYFRQ